MKPNNSSDSRPRGFASTPRFNQSLGPAVYVSIAHQVPTLTPTNHGYFAHGVGGSRPGAVALCGLGARRLQLSRVAHPEIEYVHADGPAPGSWIGLAGMAEAWRGFLSAWEGLRIEVDEYRDLNDGRVLVLTHPGGRGKSSGLELEQMRIEEIGR